MGTQESSLEAALAGSIEAGIPYTYIAEDPAQAATEPSARSTARSVARGRWLHRGAGDSVER